MNRKNLLIIISFVLAFVSYGSSTQGGEFKRDPAVNPHDHINDEGEILYRKCLICHQDIPDVKKDKFKDVTFRYEDKLQPCFSCHPQRVHPGGSWAVLINAKWKGGAPNHWQDVIPRVDIMRALKSAPDKFDVIVPLSSEKKMMCATCHNPHERGLLIGRAEIGADFKKRWRTRGMMICLYCHEK